VDAAETSGQFELRNWPTFLRDGHFDQDRMLALIQEVLDGGTKQGFARPAWSRTWNGRLKIALASMIWLSTRHD